MVKPLRHRQTKEAATDMFDLKPLRHTSTLPFATGMKPAVQPAMSAVPESGSKSAPNHINWRAYRQSPNIGPNRATLSPA